MMKLYKVARYTLSALVVLVCEQVFGKYIALGGAVPMLCLCFCVCTAAVEEEESYLIWLSAVLGAVCDSLSGHGFGTYTLTYPLAAMATFAVHNRLFSSKILFLILDVPVMTVFVQTIYYLVHITEIKSGSGFGSLILSMSVYNAVICIFMYPVVKGIFKRR